jgi:hypothetical protein
MPPDKSTMHHPEELCFAAKDLLGSLSSALWFVNNSTSALHCIYCSFYYYCYYYF